MEKVVDVVKVAIENEIKAEVFYSKAAEITSEGESQMVFIELTEMESGHARLLVDRFGDLLRQAGNDPAGFLSTTEKKIRANLGVEETDLIKKGEMRPVIEFAIRLEEQARDRYLALAKQLEQADLRSVCEDLAAEEQKHFDSLTNLRLSVDTPIDERPAL